ncbi:unnamed protein product, partial [Prorocentrum cordatum]
MMDDLMNKCILVGIEQVQSMNSGGIDGTLRGMAKPLLDRVLQGLLLEKGAKLREFEGEWWQTIEAVDEFSDDAPPREWDEFDSVTNYDSEEEEEEEEHEVTSPSVYASTSPSPDEPMSPGSPGSLYLIDMDAARAGATPETGPLCRDGHELRRAMCEGDYVCDVCQRALEPESRIHHCGRCNWGVCEQCIEAAGIAWEAAPPMKEELPPLALGSLAGGAFPFSPGRRRGKRKARRRGINEDVLPGGMEVGMQALGPRPAVAGLGESAAKDAGILAWLGFRASPAQEPTSEMPPDSMHATAATGDIVESPSTVESTTVPMSSTVAGSPHDEFEVEKETRALPTGLAGTLHASTLNTWGLRHAASPRGWAPQNAVSSLMAPRPRRMAGRREYFSLSHPLTISLPLYLCMWKC